MARAEVGVQPTLLSRIQCLCESSRAWNTSPCYGGKYKYQWNAFALTKESSSGRELGVGGLTKIVGLEPPCATTTPLLLLVTQGAKFTGKEWVAGAILESRERERGRSCFLGWRMLICTPPNHTRTHTRHRTASSHRKASQQASSVSAPREGKDILAWMHMSDLYPPNATQKKDTRLQQVINAALASVH